MSPLQALGFTMGTSFAAGLNLYATVATAGLLQYFGIIHLPPTLEILAQPLVWGIALGIFVVEFVADKIPWVDSVWDTLHTSLDLLPLHCSRTAPLPTCRGRGRWVRHSSPGPLPLPRTAPKPPPGSRPTPVRSRSAIGS